MLASVSPESYRAIINGQSDWGIFPLLLDFSIIEDLTATRSITHAIRLSTHTGYAPAWQSSGNVKVVEDAREVTYRPGNPQSFGNDAISAAAFWQLQ